MGNYNNESYGGCGFPYEEDELAAALAPDEENENRNDPHHVPYND